jgi:hypothetical protein
MTVESRSTRVALSEHARMGRQIESCLTGLFDNGIVAMGPPDVPYFPEEDKNEGDQDLQDLYILVQGDWCHSGARRHHSPQSSFADGAICPPPPAVFLAVRWFIRPSTSCGKLALFFVPL